MSDSMRERARQFRKTFRTLVGLMQFVGIPGHEYPSDPEDQDALWMTEFARAELRRAAEEMLEQAKFNHGYTAEEWAAWLERRADE